jgi:hypothetical protein
MPMFITVSKDKSLYCDSKGFITLKLWAYVIEPVESLTKVSNRLTLYYKTVRR